MESGNPNRLHGLLSLIWCSTASLSHSPRFPTLHFCFAGAIPFGKKLLAWLAAHVLRLSQPVRSSLPVVAIHYSGSVALHRRHGKCVHAQYVLRRSGQDLLSQPAEHGSLPAPASKPPPKECVSAESHNCAVHPHTAVSAQAIKDRNPGAPVDLLGVHRGIRPLPDAQASPAVQIETAALWDLFRR